MGYQNDDELEVDELELEDKELQCVEPGCPNGGTFIFTRGEQKFLHKLVNEGKTDREGKPMEYREPKRCGECRAKRKAQRAQSGR